MGMAYMGTRVASFDRLATFGNFWQLSASVAFGHFWPAGRLKHLLAGYLATLMGSESERFINVIYLH